MKNKLYILFTAALALSVSSCKKDFLDEKPSQYLSSEQIADAAENDPSLLNGSIAGLYSTMYNAFTGGTTSHDDFGQKGYDIYGDMLSSDMVLGALNYGWYRDVYRFTSTNDFTNTDGYKPWRYYYRIILSANTVIDALGGTDEPQEEMVNRHVMGQAKAMRAYSYFYLAQFFAKGYGTGTEKILPIYTNTQDPNQPLSTSAEVYQLIIEDLTQAAEYLKDFNRTSKDQVNQYVAKGLLAYALAARGTNEDLQRVITLTDDIIANGGFRLTNEDEVVARFDANGNVVNSQAGFNNIATPSWMWGVDLTLASDLDLVSWWGVIDYFTYSYAWAGDPKFIDEGLYNSIRPDDIRKGQFDPNFMDGTTLVPLLPTNKFFAPNRVIGGQRNVVTDYIYMRVDEMYLLNAEAKAKLGQDGPARTTLGQLLDLRIDDYSYINTLSGQALQNEIYLQTRIEFWGEGKSYLAMKRNKATVTRGPNHLFFDGQSFSYDDDNLTFPIPQAEVINNPALNQ